MVKRTGNYMYLDKKAEMGVGTLIVFIAMLLVAAVAAGVLIQTVSSLQEKSLSTGQQAETQISTNAMTIEVSATDGRNSNLTDFQQLVKLSPGSDAIKLDQIIFTFNTKDSTATLKYHGTDATCENDYSDGYYTWTSEKEDGNETDELGMINTTLNHYALPDDVDADGSTDYAYINSSLSNSLIINLSNSSGPLPAGGAAISFGAGVNLSNASGNSVTVSVANQPITVSGTTYGYISISGTSNTNDTLEAGMDISLITSIDNPDNLSVGEGYFSVEYEQTGTNWVDGNLQRGDIIKICYEAPEQISEDELVRLNFIPKIGTATLTEFVTPDVISTERVYLYP